MITVMVLLNTNFAKIRLILAMSC